MVTGGVTLDFEGVTLSFFARVSPLVHTHAGGAGAPDLGGLSFSRVVVVAAGTAQDGGLGRGSAAVGWKELPYLFSVCAGGSYPIF